MAELVTMYPAQANSPETSLVGALTAASTSITVMDGSVLPTAPNLLTIGAGGNTAETVLMTAKNGNILTVIRAQSGTAARAWAAGDTIGRYFTAQDQTDMQENINRLNTGKANKVSSAVAGHFAALDASGNLTDSGKKPDDYAAANHTHTGKADKVSSAVAGHFAALDASGNLTDSGKKPDDYAAASHSHAGYAKILIAQNVTVAASAWASDSTYPAYPYAASITISGVTASYVPDVVFDPALASSGNYAPVALSGSGTVTIYAVTKPTAAITLQSVTCVKAV